jgi:hypothetical protein
MPGPFTSYAPPGVYTQTEFEATTGTLPNNLRVPAYIGTGLEELLVEDFELFRGSAPFGDMFVPDEDVSNQIVSGDEQVFQLAHFPLVTGDGSNTVTTSASDVKVLVDGEEVSPNVVDGTNGLVGLITAPGAGAEVKISYYFHRTDTRVTDEDVTAQADGTTNVFKVANLPIVDGTGAGLPTTDTSTVAATVNSVPVSIEAVNGQDGTITIAVPTSSITQDLADTDVTPVAPAAGEGSYTVTLDEDPVVDASGNITNDPTQVTVVTTVSGESQTKSAIEVSGIDGVVELPYHVTKLSGSGGEDAAGANTIDGTNASLTYSTVNSPLVSSNGAVSDSTSDVKVLVNVAVGDTISSSDPVVNSVDGATGAITIDPYLIGKTELKADNSILAGDPGNDFGTTGLIANVTPSALASPAVDSSGVESSTPSDLQVTVTAGGGDDSPVGPVDALTLTTAGTFTYDLWAGGPVVTEALDSDFDGLAAANVTSTVANEMVGQDSAGADALTDLVSLSVTLDSSDAGITNTFQNTDPATTATVPTSTSIEFVYTDLIVKVVDTVSFDGDGTASQDLSLGANGTVKLVDPADGSVADIADMEVYDFDSDPGLTTPLAIKNSLGAGPAFNLNIDSTLYNLVNLAVVYYRLVDTVNHEDEVDVEYKRVPRSDIDDVEVSYNRLPNEILDTVTLEYSYGVSANLVGGDTIAVTYNHRDLPDFAEGDTVEVSYYHNTFRNTFDYLPKSGVTEIIRVGNSQGRSNYFEPTDFTLIDDRIHWGTVADVQDGVVQVGSESLADKFTAATPVDDRIEMEFVGTGDLAGTKEFTLDYVPVHGDGTDRPADTPTGSTSNLFAYVGTDVADALLNEAVIASVDALNKKVVLRDAPADGELVFVTYYANRFTDDVYTFEVTDTTNGEYTIDSLLLGPVSTAEATLPGGSSSTAYIKPVLTTNAASTTGQIWLQFASATQIDVYNGDPAGGGVKVDEFEMNQTYISKPSLGIPEGVWISIGNTQDFENTSGAVQFNFNTSGTSGRTLVIDVEQGGTFQTEFNFLKFDRYQIPGLVYVISDTDDVLDGDTATVQTYDKSGAEPEISAPYYVTFNYEKTDFSSRLITDFDDVERFYGTLSVDNRLTLAAFLAFQNGVPGVILKQVPRAEGQPDAAAQDYINALSELEFSVAGINPALIVPLSTDAQVQAATQNHVEVQSSIRLRNERVAVLGTEIGTTPTEVKQIAEGFASNRVWLVYPDGAIISLVDSQGREVEQVVDGSIVAAAFAGLNASLQFDVAEPMTNKNLAGFSRLIRVFDNTTMDNIAGSGVTILIERGQSIVVRDSLTTDMSNIFTRQPQITTIADTVQQTTRANLRQFIGRKFLPGTEAQISQTLSSALRVLQGRNIIFGFKAPKVTRGEEPDTAFITVEYQPIFGLNYIVATFKLQASL